MLFVCLGYFTAYIIIIFVMCDALPACKKYCVSHIHNKLFQKFIYRVGWQSFFFKKKKPKNIIIPALHIQDQCKNIFFRLNQPS